MWWINSWRTKWFIYDECVWVRSGLSKPVKSSHIIFSHIQFGVWLNAVILVHSCFPFFFSGFLSCLKFSLVGFHFVLLLFLLFSINLHFFFPSVCRFYLANVWTGISETRQFCKWLQSQLHVPVSLLPWSALHLQLHLAIHINF